MNEAETLCREQDIPFLARRFQRLLVYLSQVDLEKSANREPS
jgi:hypothetical protein